MLVDQLVNVLQAAARKDAKLTAATLSVEVSIKLFLSLYQSLPDLYLTFLCSNKSAIILCDLFLIDLLML